jgi:threonine dehydratase
VTAIAAAGANIVEIDHRRMFDPVSARSTNVDIVIETRDDRHRQAVMTAIERIGYQVESIS